MKKSILYSLFLLMTFSCEKDDICPADTPTTPQLIIRFYDKDSPEEFKSVTTLRVIGDGQTEPLSTVNRITTDSIAIPLRISETTTIFRMISDSADDEMGMETGNEDSITFSYQTEEVFVSRACGYKTVYSDLTIEIINEGVDNWMDIALSEVVNNAVTNQGAAHVKIYH